MVKDDEISSLSMESRYVERPYFFLSPCHLYWSRYNSLRSKNVLSGGFGAFLS